LSTSGVTAGDSPTGMMAIADDWYETVYENKHDVVNEFIRKKQSTGCSHRTLNSYSRTLKKFFHEQFPDLTLRGNRVSKTQAQRAVKDAAVGAGVVERGEDRFHKKFTPHTYRTVFTTLMRNQGTKQHVLRYIRGDAASETVGIHTRVDREDARTEYLDCIKTLNL